MKNVPKYNKGNTAQKKAADLLSKRYTENSITLVVSATVQTLASVYNWDRTQLSDFMESMKALIGEVADSRATVEQFVSNVTLSTGIDPSIDIKKLKEGKTDENQR